MDIEYYVYTIINEYIAITLIYKQQQVIRAIL